MLRMLADHRVEHDHQDTEAKAGQAVDRSGSLKAVRRSSSEHCLGAGEKSSNGDHRRQKPCRKGGAIEDHPGNRENERHPWSVSISSARMARKL